MKNWKRILILLTVVLTAVIAADGVKVGFIYSEQIMVEYQEAIDAMKKLEAEATELQNVYKEMQAEYQTMIEDYEKRKLVSSDAWKKAKQQAIVQKEQQLQSYQLEHFGQSGSIYQKEEAYLGPVLDKINETLKKIGEEEGYSFVFDASKGTIVFADEALDLTDKVLEELKNLNKLSLMKNIAGKNVLAFSPAFLYSQKMKKLLLTLTIFMILFAPLIAENHDEYGEYVKDMGYISFPSNHEYTSIHPGLVFNSTLQAFPTLTANLIIGNSYYLATMLGAGQNSSMTGGLNLFALSFGYVMPLPQLNDLSLSLGLAIRSFNSSEISSNILSSDIELLKQVGRSKLGFGISLNSQDYSVNNINAEAKLYYTTFRFLLNTPYADIAVQGRPESITTQISWSLRLDG